MGNSVKRPSVVMRQMLLPLISANQRLPSGPAVMPVGTLLALGMGNAVMVPALAQAGAVLRLSRQIQPIMAVRSAIKRDRHPELFILLPPLRVVLLIVFIRAYPPRYTRVVRGLPAVLGKPRQGRLPASRPSWAGAQ